MKRDIELILNSTHDAMIGVDTEGIITLFNKAIFIGRTFLYIKMLLLK